MTILGYQQRCNDVTTALLLPENPIQIKEITNDSSLPNCLKKIPMGSSRVEANCIICLKP